VDIHSLFFSLSKGVISSIYNVQTIKLGVSQSCIFFSPNSPTSSSGHVEEIFRVGIDGPKSFSFGSRKTGL